MMDLPQNVHIVHVHVHETETQPTQNIIDKLLYAYHYVLQGCPQRKKVER